MLTALPSRNLIQQILGSPTHALTPLHAHAEVCVLQSETAGQRVQPCADRCHQRWNANCTAANIFQHINSFPLHRFVLPKATGMYRADCAIGTWLGIAAPSQNVCWPQSRRHVAGTRPPQNCQARCCMSPCNSRHSQMVATCLNQRELGCDPLPPSRGKLWQSQ